MSPTDLLERPVRERKPRTARPGPQGTGRSGRSGRSGRQSGVAKVVRRARLGWRDGGRLRPPTYHALLATIAVLNLVGLVMVLSASSVEGLTNYGSSWLFFKRQLAWMALGFGALCVASRVDYRLLRRARGLLLVASVVLLMMVLVPGVGITVHGSTRWLGFGAMRFQPSELAKLALLLFGADLLTRRVAHLGDWRAVLRPLVVMFCFFAVLVMAQPDMGTTIVMLMITGTLVFVGGIRVRHLLPLGAATVAAGTVLAFAAPYRRARLMSFWDPFSAEHAANGGYQVAQSLIALGSGGWTGVGLGASRAKWQFLPNAHTDFIFAILGEELGLVGGVLVLVLFGALAVLGIRTALRAPDRYGMLLAAGITGWIVGQGLVNICTVIGLLPVTGVPLPFISFGGSALVFTMAAAGMLLNISRQVR